MENPVTYNALPAELKLNIWEHVLSQKGVHHFKLKSQDPAAMYQVLQVEQKNRLGKDPSMWAHRWSIYQTDRVARAMYFLWEEGAKDKDSLWTVPFRKTRNDTDTTESRGKVHKKEDLVIFTLTGGTFNPVLLDMGENQEMFRGLQNIALNYKKTQTGKWDFGKAFKCRCRYSRKKHEKLEHCPVSLVRFLRMFPNIRTFSFIFRLCGKDIDEKKIAYKGKSPSGRGTKRKADEEAGEEAGTGKVPGAEVAKKKPATQTIEEALAEFRGTFQAWTLPTQPLLMQSLAKAEKRKRVIWRDSERMYYEVDEQITGKLNVHHKLWVEMKELQTHWRAEGNPNITEHERKCYAKTKFKVLICRDLMDRKKKAE
ncbi:uncharacterized protein JN550_000593 [Neoarthrinium moseri]|uniref:uncharacterized protein n=1 Tax=Neoarthrinium moseri TaxID=1658444 RepID=UPI001FDB89B7|nr:uncharacterized protein JN550_000593 [Neoarthrinium moseri]KAI1878411.1 hypothetical protein JN550_000593 [Neoarthrinium moseri]